jgi:tryptophan-rich sensory protein
MIAPLPYSFIVAAKRRRLSPEKRSSLKKRSPKVRGFFDLFFSWLDRVSPLSIFVIGLGVVVVSIISSLFVDMYQWYVSVPIEVVNFSTWVFGYMLSGIFAFVTASIVILWNERGPGRGFLIWLFVLAGILHVMWNMFFFALHVVSVSVFVGFALWLLLWAIFFLAWRRSLFAAFLLLPYLSWVTFVVAFSGFSLSSL